MVKIAFNGRVVGIATVVALLGIAAATPAQAQDSQIKIHRSFADDAAAQTATDVKLYAHGANTLRGSNASRAELSAGHSPAHQRNTGSGNSGELVRYPGDLTFQGGNPNVPGGAAGVVFFAKSHEIYYDNGNCPTVATCWGDPQHFLRDLGRSNFIHVTDQYVGLSADNRYTIADKSFHYTPATPTNPFLDIDILTAVHAAAAASGETGYTNIYHFFLPKGQDVCFSTSKGTNSGVCYSPDNPPTFAFCAYHGSVDFSDIGHVLFTVQPYANVLGCQVKPGTVNGSLIDSTDNSLSHETIETITDPDGLGWWNLNGNAPLLGQEIGDECVYVFFQGNNAYYDVFPVSLGRNQYDIQLEYSNAAHACVGQ